MIRCILINFCQKNNFEPFFQAAIFLSTLAMDISVGLSSWVNGDLEKEENDSKITSEDTLEVLRSDSILDFALEF